MLLYIIILVICLYCLCKKYREKFNIISPSPSNEIEFEEFIPKSPIIKKIRKEKENVLVEWDNDNVDKIKEFIVLLKSLPIVYNAEIALKPFNIIHFKGFPMNPSLT